MKHGVRNKSRFFVTLWFGVTVITAAGLFIIAGHVKAGTKITLLSSNTAQINDNRTPANPFDSKPAIQNLESLERWQTANMRVTAYCPCEKCCGPDAHWITASGHKIRPGEVFVAADKHYSFGTELVIPGYNDNKPVKVLDRGGAIHGNHIDIFFASHREALAWGVKSLDVQIRVN